MLSYHSHSSVQELPDPAVLYLWGHIIGAGTQRNFESALGTRANMVSIGRALRDCIEHIRARKFPHRADAGSGGFRIRVKQLITLAPHVSRIPVCAMWKAV